jgi:hypothetical protein
MLKRVIANIILKSRTAFESKKRKGAFLSWDSIQKIALVISKRDNINKSQVDQFITGTKKYVEVFYIELDSKTPTYNDWNCFTKKDRSFVGLPSGAVLQGLSGKQFDVVINTCQEIELYSTALAGILHAPLKCGSSNRFNDSDLVIKKTGINSIMDYLHEVVRYLKMIRMK